MKDLFSALGEAGVVDFFPAPPPPTGSGVFLLKDGENLGMRLFFSDELGVADLARGEGALLLPGGTRSGWGGGVPMLRLLAGGVLDPDTGATTFRALGSRLDFERWR